MGGYLMDTNAVSAYLSDSVPSIHLSAMDQIVNDGPHISVITQIELLCWKTDSKTSEKVESFIQDSNVLDISQNVIKECVKLRRSRKIKTPDAIIAATAIANGFTLVTNNKSDFSSIKGLKLLLI